ncbi:3017_t:CDS:1, partial [Funneliformis caledonium]
MVKKKGTIWNHWTIITQSSIENNEIKPSLHPSVKCNYCSKVFNRAVPLRMQAHLNECLNAPSNAKLQKTIPIQNPIPSNITEHPLTNTNTPLIEKNRSKKQIKLDNFVDNMKEEEQESLEFLLAQALYSAGVPFTFVDNPFVIQFFKYLRPSFKLPNRKKIANELLDEVYEDVKIQADEQISKATTLCMVSDGWSNINRDSVHNFVICTPKPFFFDATFSGEESHTAEWIADQIIQQMDIIGIQKFSAVITDTTNVMKAAWRNIEEKYPNIVCLGCNSHIINLLIKDILCFDEIKAIVNNAKSIVIYFRSHLQAAAKLKRIQLENYNKEITLVLPVLTRWGTHLSCFQSLKKSRIALEQSLMDPLIRQKMDQIMRNNILSDEFWQMVDLIINILEPIVVALKSFESDTSILSTIYSYYSKLIEQF